MASVGAKTQKRKDVTQQRDIDGAAVSAIVLQYPGTFTPPASQHCNTADQPFQDESTHNGWESILGLNA